MPRLLAAAVLLGALAAFSASPAAAARPLGYPNLLTTAHFEIHYTGDLGPPVDPSRIVDQQAGDLAANAERAYATITGWGYPPPLDDGDGKTDIYVTDLSSVGALGLTIPDTAGNVTTAYIEIDPTVVDSEHVIAHELFHAVQFGIWIPADAWLLEGSAEWTGFAADNYDPAGAGATKLSDTLSQPDMSLDCVSDACGPDPYENGGYSRWSFFEYLAERFGNGFMKDVFSTGAALNDPTATGETLLADTLQAKGTTIGSTFNDYSAHVIAGNFQLTALQGVAPTTYGNPIQTGTQTAALPITRVAVNHLAARYLDFTPGTGSAVAECYAATLALTVALPAGLGSQPYFYSTSAGTTALPLSVNGSTASLNVPWNTCAGAPAGYLSLPNPSTTADGQTFTVSGTLTVDTSTVSSATAAPDPLDAGPGAVVAAPTTDLAPAIYLYGAQVIRVSTSDRMVRLIVFSSGPGMLSAKAGSTNLGTYQLRPGNNDVRFKLPQSLVNALRKPAAAASPSLLTLTSLSSNGTAGTTVSRKLAVVKPAPKKASKAHD